MNGDIVAFVPLAFSNRTESERVITASGRAPMVKMSRRIPPTPVAAPERLDVRRMVSCDSNLEGADPASPNVDNAGVLPPLYYSLGARGRRLWLYPEDL